MRIKNAAFRLAIVAMVCGLCTASARTGDFVDMTFPRGMGAHLSIRSTDELLKGMDAGVAASTAGTDEPVPAGTILKWAAERLPFLTGDEGLDLEMHLFLPPMMHEMAVFGHALIISNLSFGKFTEIVEKVGGQVAMDKGGIATLTLRGAPPYRIIDAGDDMIALAFQPEVLRMLRREFKNGWRPAHWADGAIGLSVETPGEWLFASAGEAMERKLALVEDWLSRGEPSPALEKADRDVLLKVLESVRDAVPAAMEEMDGITRMGLDIRADGERLGLALRVLADPSTRLGRAGASASERRNLDTPLLDKVDDGAIQIFAVAPREAILPGLGEMVVEWAGAIGERAFPEHGNGIVDAARAYYVDAASGASVNAGYFDSDFMRNIVYTESEDPAALAEAWVGVLKAANNLIGAAFPGVDGAAVEVRDGKTGTGIPCRNIDWNGDFMDAYWEFSQEFFSVLQERPSQPAAKPAWLAAPSTQLAASEGFLVSMTNPEDDVDAMDMAVSAGPAARPLAGRESAARTIADMRLRQNLLVLTDYNFVTDLLFANMPAAPGGRALDPATRAKRMERVRPLLRKADSLVGMAAGGEDGCVTMDFSIPTDTIAVMYHNIKLMADAGLLPGVSGSTLTANEASAVSNLKVYVTAQVTFQLGRQGRIDTNTGTGEKGYADNYRNLYYGKPAGAPDDIRLLSLISRAQADAFAGPTARTAASSHGEQPAGTATPYRGYLFLEPPGIDFATEYALVAYPAKYGISGDKIFYIDEAGTVYAMEMDKREGGLPDDGEFPALLSKEETPAANPGLWRPM